MKPRKVTTSSVEVSARMIIDAMRARHPELSIPLEAELTGLPEGRVVIHWVENGK